MITKFNRYDEVCLIGKIKQLVVQSHGVGQQCTIHLETGAFTFNISIKQKKFVAFASDILAHLYSGRTIAVTGKFQPVVGEKNYMIINASAIEIFDSNDAVENKWEFGIYER